jgi:hypothetical protein
MNYQTLAQEALKRWPALDPARLERAIEIAARPGMIYNARCNAGEFDVRASNGTGWYHVNTKARTCTCPDSHKGHVCKHRLAVWLFVEARTRPAAQARRVDTAVIMGELGYA